MGGCIYGFEFNKGKGYEDDLRKSYEVLIALLDGNDLVINNIFDKDGSIKNDIRTEVANRLNFCREASKEAIPTLVKLPVEMGMRKKRLEIFY